ncbi:hypothetical protein Lser_V15G01040 [Lactuca serriola]
MIDEMPKRERFSWSKSLVRKWLSIWSKSEEFQTDKGVYGGGDGEWRNTFS